jgi:hypothetical protein
MTVPRALDLLDQIAILAEQARLALMSPPEPPKPAIIKTAAELDRALLAATDGARLLLDPTFTYPNALKLAHVNLTLESTTTLNGRMTKVSPAPRFDKGIVLVGSGIHLVGLDIRNSTGADIVIVSGKDCALDRCRVLGDPVTGAKRGIAANSDGNCQITGCYVDDCFGPYPGNDTQAICAWSMGPGLLIENCYLAGGTETVMIGGSDAPSPQRDPANIIIRGNTITKNPAWQTQPVSVKNTLELKNARHVLIEDNDISYSWAGRGQTGFLLVLTVRNQDGKDPTASIQDVTIQGNRFAHGAAAINILGHDNLQPSEPMQRVTIAHNTFEDLNPLMYQTKIDTASRKMIQIDGGSVDLVIAENTFAGTNLTSALYFAGGPALERFTFVGNRYPKTKYGVYGNNVTVGQAWAQFVTSGTNGPNTEV